MDMKNKKQVDLLFHLQPNGRHETCYYFKSMDGELAEYDYDAIDEDGKVIRNAGSRGGLPKPIEYAIPQPPTTSR